MQESQKKENFFEKNKKNPKFRSGVILIGYFLLGLGILSLARQRTSNYTPNSNTNSNHSSNFENQSTDVPEKDQLTEEKEILRIMQNYAYIITITEEETEEKIQGMRNKNEELFSDSTNQAYYLKENQYYKNQNGVITPIYENWLSLELRKLKPENIEQLIEPLSPEIVEETQIFYQIPLATFAFQYSGDIMVENKTIPLTIQLKNSEISFLQLDLTNYFQEKKVVTFEFSEQGKIKDWSIPIE